MEQSAIPNLVTRRNYLELEKRADEYIENGDWNGFLKQIQHTNSIGKSRDALVALLELDAVGGTDSDIFTEFSSLEGNSLHEVRLDGVLHAMEILKDQIQNKHTYFLDVEGMAETPYAILVKDVIEARKNELAQLEKNPSRIDVLGTYYGFAILMVEGSKPHENQTSTGYGWRRWRRRTWLDERITDTAAQAMKGLTGQFAQEVDIDKRYRTLGSSPIFKSRCTKETANILADAVRLALYKVPGNRGTAARNLGRSGDSRVLPFLHHRCTLEQSGRVRISIADALGNVGHTSSIDVLKEQINITRRGISKEVQAAIGAIGGIYSPKCKSVLLDLITSGGNMVKAAAIEALGNQEPSGLVEHLTPYLHHKSRPVVRASVVGLIKLGSDGKDAVRDHAAIALNRIGYDKPSHKAVVQILELPNVSQMRHVQVFFANRIYKIRKEVERWKQRGTTGSYSYWYNRRERRAIQDMNETISMVNKYLQAPFQSELLNSVEAALKVDPYLSDISRALNHSELARAIIDRQPKPTVKKNSGGISNEQPYYS